MRTLSNGFLRAFFVVVAVLFSVPAIAQLPTTIPISNRPQAVDEILNRGHQLELERRWGDALSHYEEALRQYPAEAGLQRQFDTARLHYDIQRRSADRSFCDTLSRMTLDQALNLYSQVLLKIESH